MSFNFIPRVLRRESAAFYLSLSPEEFDAEVEAGRMPAPFRLVGEIKGWDREELDLWASQKNMEVIDKAELSLGSCEAPIL